MLEVKVEQPTEARAESDVTLRAIVVARGRTRTNQSSSEPLVVALGVIVLDEFAQEIAEVPLAEDHKVFEAFCAGGPDKPFGVGIAVRTARRNRHALRRFTATNFRTIRARCRSRGAARGRRSDGRATLSSTHCC